MNVVLDTCAIIWAVAEPARLPAKVKTILTAAETELYVSPISCAELACAVDRGKVTLDLHWRSWFRYYVEQNGWSTIDINLNIIEEAYSLPEPFHRDPADRIIVATARRLDCPIVTADKKIIEYPHVETMWES